MTTAQPSSSAQSSSLAQPSPSLPGQPLPRSQVPAEQTWDLGALYPTPAAWDAAAEAFGPALAALGGAGMLGQGPRELADFLNRRETLRVTLARLGSYAGMAASVDGRDSEAAARRDRAGTLSSEYARAVSFVEPELLELDEATLRAWLARPELKDHRVALERLLETRPHVRGAEVEELLGALGLPFASERSIHPTLVNMDLDFGEVDGTPVGHGNVGRLTASSEREVRRRAWEGYADAHLALKHGMAAALVTNARQNVFLARARRYPDALSAAMTPDGVPTAVFHTLIDAYLRNIGVWHRYWDVRRRWLGLDQLREYDVQAPLTGEVQMDYPQAVDAIVAGMAPLGEDYVTRMRAGLTTERWVDWAGNLHKRQGAYSNGSARVKPYIFMSWQGGYGSMSTLAHEIGHSMHSLLSYQHASSVPRYTLFAAEVASNFNQAMVRHHLFSQVQGDAQQEVAVIEEAMGNFHRYFFIMPTLARFELELHRRVAAGLSVSAPDLNALMADLLSDGYGQGVTMDRERSGILWGQFSTHLYSPFYAYQYATGISAAHSLRARFDREPEQAREDYLAFLRAGGSLRPLDALRLAGVDMLSAEPVEQTFEVLRGYVERLETLLQERGPAASPARSGS